MLRGSQTTTILPISRQEIGRAAARLAHNLWLHKSLRRRKEAKCLHPPTSTFSVLAHRPKPGHRPPLPVQSYGAAPVRSLVPVAVLWVGLVLLSSTPSLCIGRRNFQCKACGRQVGSWSRAGLDAAWAMGEECSRWPSRAGWLGAEEERSRGAC